MKSGRHRVFIVEDMAFTRMELEAQLTDAGFDIAGSEATAEKAWELLKLKPSVDIVLIDINLAGDKDGIWLAKKIRKYLSLAIVYLTAFGDEETIAKVQDTLPNGFLMKPFNDPTLINTLMIAIRSFNARFKLTQELVSRESSISLKEGSKYIRIDLDDIYYINSDGNYLLIHTSSKKHVVRMKMSQIKEMLPQLNFLKVHRRFLINIKYVKSMEKETLIIGNDTIPISSTYKKRLKEIFQNSVHKHS
ncbi:response regulator transcription factor [bacterium]|nr:response regulator transcription factor [bacterium]